MLAFLEKTNSLALWIRIAITSVAVGVAYFLQIPVEIEVPGEPFLLFFAVCIGSTLLFGRGLGFLAVGASALLCLPFFEPHGSFNVYQAVDLVKVEMYALFSSAAVFVMARLSQTLIAADESNKRLTRLEEQKSLLLSELSHRVANNFAAIAALIRQRSVSIADPQAKSVLLAATEQMRVMARIHGRLCLGDRAVSLDTRSFLEGLCQDVRTSIGSSSPILIECSAVSLILPVGAAVPLGLIVNELITNAVKYAFPDGHAGTIRVSLSEFGTRLRLSVRDDGVGLQAPGQGTGLGLHLVQALAKQIGSKVDIKSRERGTVISMTFDTPPEPDVRSEENLPIAAGEHAAKSFV
jgi:two-component sensor histidine kinase